MIDIELIIFAAVAIFVISRLYAVLGKKTGAEPPPSILKEGAARRVEDAPSRPTQAQRPVFTGPGASGLEAIAEVDPQFNPRDFLIGAKRAYELIVGAFAEGDKAALRDLLDDEVFAAYSEAIDARAASGAEPLRLLRLKNAEIADADLQENGVAQVSVSFEANLTDGEHQRYAREKWTFERIARSDDPNWRLAEVVEAS